MTKLEKNALANYARYQRSVMDSIYSAYQNPSEAKREVWENCKRLCYKQHGKNLKVISKNCQFFSAGFEFTDAVTGMKKFMRITPSHNTAVEIAQAG